MALLRLFGITDASTPELLELDSDDLLENQEMSIALSDETTPLTGASTTIPKATFHLPYAFNITGAKAGLRVAGTGAALVKVDIKKSSVSIFTTLITIDAGEKTSGTAVTPAVLTAAPVAGIEDEYIECFLTVIDTDNVAAGLKVYLIGTAA